jgi:threonine synthase
LILRAIRESGGSAVAVPEATLLDLARFGTGEEGIDFCPEGGAAIAGALTLRQRGELADGEQVVIFNTGAGWLYRAAEELPGAGG